MRKNIIKIITFIVLAGGIGIGIGYHPYFSKVVERPLSSTNFDPPNIKFEEVTSSVGMVAEYAADFANDEILMGASHDVFVGEVVSQVGDKERGIGPETQFAVEVVLDIKGNLRGTVTVDQQGGYDNGVLYYIEDGASLLEPGVTYLLATRYNSQENWYTLNPSVSGSQFIIDDSSLSVDQLRAMAENDLRVKQLEAAYPNEILPEADIKNDNTLNSYQSLHAGVSTSSISANISP
jgi:hypothetical protein